MIKRIGERNGHMAAIYALRPAPDGIYSAAADGYIVHWHHDDVDFGKVVAKVDGGKFFSLAVLPDGGLVAGAVDGGVHWLYPEEPDRNKHVARHTRGVYAVELIGDFVFTAGGDGVLTKWNRATGRTIESTPVSPNSLRCLTAHRGELLLVGASDGKVYFVELESMRVIGSQPANEPSTFCLSVLPGPSPVHYVSGGRDAHLRFGELALVKKPKRQAIPAHLATVNDLAFSPDGRHLATASRDKTVKIWNAEDFRLLKVIEVVRDRGHVNSVNTLLWTDNRTLFTAGDDRRILEWRLNE